MDTSFIPRRRPPSNFNSTTSEANGAPFKRRELAFRLLCPATKTSTISEGSLHDLRGTTIRVLEEPPPLFSSYEERVILVSSAERATTSSRADANSSLTEPEDGIRSGLNSENRQGVGATVKTTDREEPLSLAQCALVRVFETIVSTDGSNSRSSESGNDKGSVVCRMLVRSDQVDSRFLERLESIRRETEASVIVLPAEKSFASPRDELIEITGGFSAAKEALLSISSCLQENTMPDPANSGAAAAKTSGGLPASTSTHADSFPQLGHPSGPHPPDCPPMDYSPFAGPEVVGANRRMVVEEEVIFKLLCQREKVGSVIGKGGSVVRAMQNETGAYIKVSEGSPDSDEKVIIISARENLEQIRSSAQDAVMRVHHRITEIGFEPGVAVIARLLVPSHQIGCLVGKGVPFLNELERATGASIRVFMKEQSSKFDSNYHEVVQILGNPQSVQDALFHITGRIRETIFPIKSPTSSFVVPPHLPSFNEMHPPFSRPRHDPHSPSRYPSSVAIPHAIDRPIPPPPPFDLQPPFPHGVDRSIPHRDSLPHPFAGDKPGYGPPFDRPRSPRIWTQQGFGVGNSRGMADFGSGRAPGSWPRGSGNQGSVVTGTSIEIVVPQTLLGHVHGEDDGHLNQIRQISGAKVDIHDPKHGASEGIVLVSGTSDQVRVAQSLVQAFILCGKTS